jgi:hypothetical protein
MVPDIPGDETVTVDDNVNELGSKPFVRTSRGVVGEAEGAALRGTHCEEQWEELHELWVVSKCVRGRLSSWWVVQSPAYGWPELTQLMML